MEVHLRVDWTAGTEEMDSAPEPHLVAKIKATAHKLPLVAKIEATAHKLPVHLAHRGRGSTTTAHQKRIRL